VWPGATTDDSQISESATTDSVYQNTNTCLFAADYTQLVRKPSGNIFVRLKHLERSRFLEMIEFNDQIGKVFGGVFQQWSRLHARTSTTHTSSASSCSVIFVISSSHLEF
jgi:hypothetical protein